MKFPDLGPLALLIAGFASGVLAALLFANEITEIPQGWGSVLGSILGVIGAFYIARLSFNLEHRSKTAESNRPLLNQVRVAFDALNDANIAMSEFEELTVELSNSFTSFVQNEDRKQLTRLRKMAVNNSLSYEDEQILDEIEENYAPTVALAVRAYTSYRSHNPIEFIGMVGDTISNIRNGYQHLLDHDEIVAMKHLASDLSGFSDECDRAIQTVIDIAEWSPRKPLPNHGFITILFGAHVSTKRTFLISKAAILPKIQQRLEKLTTSSV